LELVVVVIALAATVFVWRKVANGLSGRNGLIRHGAGYLIGSIAFSVIVWIASELGITQEDPEEKTRLQAERLEQAATSKRAKLAEPYEKVKSQPLSEAREFSIGRARQVAAGYAAMNAIPEEDHDAFYRCFGHLTRTKGEGLPIHLVMSWCLHDYTNDRQAFLTEHTKYDYFAVMDQFSRWDGSHAATSAFIKRSMHDPDSFKHVETKFNIQSHNSPPDMIVLTKFRGTNVLGAVVTDTVKVRVDLQTGQVLGVID